MENQDTKSLDPITSPVQTPPPSIPPSTSKPAVFPILFVVLILALLGATGVFAYQNWQMRQRLNAPTTYEECIKAPGSSLQESYPGTCVTKDGKSFVQPLTDEEKKNLQPPDQNPDYKRSCVERGGLWLTEYLECESMSSPNLNSEWCTDLKGEFSECQSPCRHAPKFQSGEVNCATVCVKVCQFN